FSCSARAIAIHEAGHAVAATVLGHGVAYATIIPRDARHLSDNATQTGTLLGHVRYKSPPVPEVRAVTSLAGPIAESVYTGIWDRWIGADDDYRAAQGAILDMAGLLDPKNEPILQMYARTAEWDDRIKTACEFTQGVI